MSVENVMAELKGFEEAQAGKPYSSRDHVSASEIERWSALIGEPRAVLYDLIAIFFGPWFPQFGTEL